MVYTRSVILLAAFVACVQSLPAAHLTPLMPASKPANLNLRGGGNALLTEKQVVLASTILAGLSGVHALLAPENLAKAYQINNYKAIDITLLRFLGARVATNAGLLHATGNLGMPLKKAIGYSSAFYVLFFAFQLFSSEGDIVKLNGERKPHLVWLVLHIICVYLSFSDSKHMDKFIKFLAGLNFLNAILPTFFYDKFIEVYGAGSASMVKTKVGKSLSRHFGTTNLGYAAYLWISSSGANISACMLPLWLAGAVYWGQAVATQEWREIGMPNGVACMVWFTIAAFMATNTFLNK